MPGKALRSLRRFTRGAPLLLALVFTVVGGTLSAQGTVVGAQFLGPTRAYPHAVLGDDIEYGVLTIDATSASGKTVRRSFAALPDAVFEDLAPRLWQIDGKNGPEVVVVQSSLTQGASLAVYHAKGILAQTPYIGRPNRWLAPVGAADFDGDGHIEIGFIDRPHLARTLRLWRYREGKLTQVAALEGLTNHKIGWDFISSGTRDCGQGPEMITADAGWNNIMATRYDGAKLQTRRIGPYTGPRSITRALSCTR